MYLLNTVVDLVYGKNAMSDDLKGTIITAIVTGVISIIGFIVTNISMKKSFRNELRRQRDSLELEKMSKMPYEVLALMDEMIESGKIIDDDEKRKSIEQNYKHLMEIMNTVYSYGSEKAIEIASLMQKENYTENKRPGGTSKYRVLSEYALLATQIKYDVTGISVCPKLWFQMRLKDYEEHQDMLRDANNQLVDELSLRIEFKIKK